ncbi:TetR/AcrR family transcriptional regulator [Salinarimonas ramus]|uniref:TetR/AcrR family transcriptional regulator n=1 Tax=Salinarimonas ramus TaxID=690164 RepID=UPI001FCE78A5|nr:TetR family transcriptional regulator [Salinarimonas ramus]
MTPPRPPVETATDVRLLRIAADHLARFGPRRLTVTGVAEEAGMTHANVYRYYPSKADLIDAVAGQWLRDVEAELANVVDGPDPVEDKLERFVTAIATSYRACAVEQPTLFEVYVSAVEESRGIARKHRGRQLRLLERILEEGIATEAFAPKDRDRAVAFVIDAVQRFVNPVMVRVDARVPSGVMETRLGTMIEVVLRALHGGWV